MHPAYRQPGEQSGGSRIADILLQVAATLLVAVFSFPAQAPPVGCGSGPPDAST